MRCAFTGHRPEKLPWGSREEDPRAVALKVLIAKAIRDAYGQGFRIFACGFARGSDQYFLDCVRALMLTCPDVELEAWLPCPEQASRWSEEDRARHDAALNICTRVVTQEAHYSPGCMLRRNRAMIDASQLLISVYDGSGGGTGATVAYAARKGVPVHALWL